MDGAGKTCWMPSRCSVQDERLKECVICLERVSQQAIVSPARNIREVLGHLWLCTNCVPDCDIDVWKKTAPRVSTCWSQPSEAVKPCVSRPLVGQRPSAARRPPGSGRCTRSVSPAVVGHVVTSVGHSGLGNSAKRLNRTSLGSSLALLGGAVAAVRGAAVAVKARSPSCLRADVQRPRAAKGSQAGEATVNGHRRYRSSSRCRIRHEDSPPRSDAAAPRETPTCKFCCVYLGTVHGNAARICTECVLHQKSVQLGRKPTSLWLEEALLG
eukprot:TRINITY_DN25028_c0_g1_i1.p1 TRINITY_DN25028_c0_g1~~TRINITY_DN25028_c0_g1_i1.p1  ORF type:complete len:270 (+),score=27.06 TRINITY_DN25028_c0_g1_i1:97-906(+)